MKYTITLIAFVMAASMPLAALAMEEMAPANEAEVQASMKEQSAAEMKMDASQHENAVQQARSHYNTELAKAKKTYDAAMRIAMKKKSKVLQAAAKKKYTTAKMMAKKHYEAEKNAAMKRSKMKLK